MKIKLKKDHGLFQRLKNSPPQWWNNLKSDNEIYIDVRKDNYLNIYHNGGSIMKLEGAKNYKAHIHFEYMPLQKVKEYLPFNFQNDNISFLKHEPIELNNFSKEPLEKIKKRIKKFYPNDSEKGIQGNYVVKNNYSSEKTNGFFIDTEFQYANGRIDMVWVDLETQKIAFVELKTMGDERLYVDKKQEHKNKASDTIDVQLGKYYEFVSNNIDDLIKYYNKVYCIKKELGLLPEFVKEQSLVNYELIEKPILLVGDCSQEWINNNADELNKNIKDVAFGSLYQGKTTYNFRIPYKSSQNCFRLSEV